MKLIVQIPCLNEEATLPATIADIPRQIDGLDAVEILVIDDGSTDGTAAVARACGADHIVQFPQNRGLGHAFKAGFDTALRLGADIIVNTDGDNQYYGGDVPKLVQPILEGRADLVIGDRRTGDIGHFSFLKRTLQRVGSHVISRLGGIDVPDVASGFRAYTRETALRISMFTGFDHTAEHVVQAGQDRWGVVVVPIRTNPKARESRLFANVGEFVLKSGAISLRTYARYKALKIFAAFGAVAFAGGVALGLRFLYYYLFTAVIAQGLGVGLVPAALQQAGLPGVAFVPLARPLAPYDTHCLWRTGRDQSALGAFLAAVRATAQTGHHRPGA